MFQKSRKFLCLPKQFLIRINLYIRGQILHLRKLRHPSRSKKLKDFLRAYKRNARQFGGFSGNSAGASALSGIQGVPNENDINIGGIQVEGVEEVLRRLKIQETIMNKEPTTPCSSGSLHAVNSNMMPTIIPHFFILFLASEEIPLLPNDSTF